ncbi:putative RNA helicase [Elasticomyces elasticus]|nr:putative RNA helicase [Elasticomyces elasticus]KAK3636772.1 putative RNA helicase [Elasticomyces elasticus]KAK4912364.1 putative RNA helicase [Elasticomyces elasticus]KAK5751841.1 putative RNA helicase [Elasticomyces elasticus]
MERPTKRRRVSDDLSEASTPVIDPRNSVHDLESISGDDEIVPPPVTISRIKKKTISPRTESAAPKKQLPVTETPTNLDPENPTFATLTLPPWLLTSLRHLSITSPTPIQSSTIPPILSGTSLIASSPTGSGKTLAFALPILTKWSQNPSGIYALILTPTRELALQIYEQVIAIGSPQNLRVCLITGGADMRSQAIELERRPHVVIATPGRLADHVLNSGEDTVRGLRRVKFLVLDEADRLLAPAKKGSMLPDLETCLTALPASGERQTLLFTATVTPELRAMAGKPQPPSNTKTKPAKPALQIVEIESGLNSLAIPETLRQMYQLVNVVHKEKYLHVLLGTPANETKSTIIFCNRTTTATLVEYLLRLLGHRVTALHSGLQHTARVSNLARFRAGAARVMVATDVAARGLDIPDVGLVINYDLPRNPDDYIHRVGRTARAGRRGTSISLVGQRDVELVKGIEARVGRVMVEYDEEKVSVEGRVVRDALNVVGDRKREALLAIEEGRDVEGRRGRKMVSRKKRE